VLIGVAMYLVWTGSESPSARSRVARWWFAQLLLNLAWSLIFFGRRAIGPAFGEILILWLAIAATIRPRRSKSRQRRAARPVPGLDDIRCDPQRVDLVSQPRPLSGVVERSYTRPMETAPNLTPVLGRYFQREWSHGEGHRLYDTSGKAYLDFANGIAVTRVGPRAPQGERGDPRPG
jgi:hypothetical protein